MWTKFRKKCQDIAIKTLVISVSNEGWTISPLKREAVPIRAEILLPQKVMHNEVKCLYIIY